MERILHSLMHVNVTQQFNSRRMQRVMTELLWVLCLAAAAHAVAVPESKFVVHGNGSMAVVVVPTVAVVRVEGSLRLHGVDVLPELVWQAAQLQALGSTDLAAVTPLTNHTAPAAGVHVFLANNGDLTVQPPSALLRVPTAMLYVSGVNVIHALAQFNASLAELQALRASCQAPSPPGLPAPPPIAPGDPEVFVNTDGDVEIRSTPEIWVQTLMFVAGVDLSTRLTDHHARMEQLLTAARTACGW